MDKRDLCSSAAGREDKPAELKKQIAVFVHTASLDAPSLGDIFRACSLRAGIWQCARSLLSEGGVVFPPRLRGAFFFTFFVAGISHYFLQDVLSSRGGSEGGWCRRAV